MTEVKRTGPPTPRAVKGRVFTWTIPINGVPPAEWKHLFTDTRDRAITCSPDGVKFYLATMIFESDEATVPTWIEFIDRWVAAANVRYAKYCEEQEVVRAKLDEEHRDAAARLRDAAEKFKNL